MEETTNIFYNVEILNAVLGIVGLILTFVIKKVSDKYFTTKENDKKTTELKNLVVSSVLVGVDKTYQEYVRELKGLSADGKLTSDEKKIALSKAKEYAIEYAKNAGLDLSKFIGTDYLTALIEDTITLRKKNSKFK